MSSLLVFQAIHIVASFPLCPTVWGHQPPDLLAANQMLSPAFYLHALSHNIPSCCNPFGSHCHLAKSY